MHFQPAPLTSGSCLSLLLCLLLMHCVPVAQTGNNDSGNNSSNNARNTGSGALSDGTYEDRILDANIKNIQLNLEGEPLFSSAIPLVQNQPLLLTFDELELGPQNDEYVGYNYQIIHCNADWRKSRLYNMDFLYEYNQYAITTENFSFNTKVPFIQYTFQVPRVKVPGNYIVKVYRGNNENDVVFTKRLMVYDAIVGVGADLVRSTEVSARETHHQLEFVVDYSKVNIPNPLNDVVVVIRQNYQWFNAIYGIKPTFVQEQDRRLEYRHFNQENNFYAGNEYRYFDIRALNSFGQNVGEIDREKIPVEVFLLPDKSRSREAYSQYQEQDGAFYIENAETRAGVLNADYVNTHFFLNTSEITDGEVYVTGAFNNRTLTGENRMTYDANLKGYTLNMLLKQGFYNYLYYVKSDGKSDPYRFEGNYFQTGNQYEIFVYIRPLGTRADQLVGYTRISSANAAYNR